MAITALHHLFIQSCMSRRSMSSSTAQVIYAKCIQAVGENRNTVPNYATMLDEVNGAIEVFGFSIKHLADEHSGLPWIAFVNTKDDEMAKVATEYSPQEINFFRTLIKKIMRSGKRYAINDLDARRIGGDMDPKISPSNCEALLANFVARGWLVVVNGKVNGKNHEMYQLSVRSRMELEHYLGQEFPKQMDKDHECRICDELVMKGVECATNNCQTRMHDYCAKTWFARTPDPKCPKWTSIWRPQNLVKIGPDALDSRDTGSDSETSDNDNDAPPPATRPGRSTKQTRPSANANDEENEEENEATPPPAPASRRQSRNTTAASARRGSGVPRDSPRDSPQLASARRARTASRAAEVKPEDEEEGVDQIESDEEEDEDDDDDDDLMTARRNASEKKQKEKEKAARKKK